MSKKITITLSDKAERYFNELMYSLPGKDGYKAATQSDCINESLENLSDFEKETDNQLLNWLIDYRKLKGNAKIFASDPDKSKYSIIKITIN